jgi:hypothetical protein
MDERDNGLEAVSRTPEEERVMAKEKVLENGAASEIAGAVLESAAPGTVVELRAAQIDPGIAARAAASATVAERARVTEIRKLATGKGAHVGDELVTQAIADGMTVDQAARAFLEEERVARSTPGRTEISLGATGGELLTHAVSDAVAMGDPVARYKPKDAKALEAAEEFQGISLRMMAMLALRSAGQPIPLRDYDLYTQAVSTLYLPEMLGDSARKILLATWEAYQPTFLRWAARRSAKDFLEHKEIALSMFSSFEEVGPGGELKFGDFAELKTGFQVKTYGRKFGITRQMFINDDLGGFTRMLSGWGVNAGRNINRRGYAALVSNSGVGPLMAEDSCYLFSLAAGRLAGSGANTATGADASGLNMTGLTTARKLLRNQKGIPNPEGESEALNLTARYLLVPSSLETEAFRYMNSQQLLLSQTQTTTTMERGSTNPHAGLAEVIPEALLDAATNGTTAWYLMADGNIPGAATLGVAFLNGVETPIIEPVPQMSALSREWEIFHDMAIATLGHRGAVRMVGA